MQTGPALSNPFRRSRPTGVATTPIPAWPLRGRTYWLHLALPLSILGALLLWAGPGGGDTWVADRIYTAGHGAWVLRSAWMTDRLVHVAGRNLSILAGAAVFAAWLASFRVLALRRLRRPLGYLFCALAAGSLAVAWMKSWSNMDCPWDLARYGGERPFVGLLEVRPPGMPRARCFPAGHASGGYIWLSLYFFLGTIAPRWRWPGLCVGMGAGLVFGISQQLRGAHFLSHDLWTAGICWTLSLALYALLLRGDATSFRPEDAR